MIIQVVLAVLMIYGSVELQEFCSEQRVKFEKRIDLEIDQGRKDISNRVDMTLT